MSQVTQENSGTGTSGTSEKPQGRPRGFAAMNQQKQREIARKGGKAAHEKGTAHEFTADEARAAGRKGGERVSVNRSHMANIGRMGGKNSAARRAASTRASGSEATDHGSPENGEKESTPGQG